MPSDPCKWQRKTCGYKEMVVYPQEGSRSWKLHWSSITWKFNLAWPFGVEVSSCASLVSWRGHFQRRSAKTFWPYPEPEDILIDIERCMNNWPLLYQGKEFQQPVLTPNTLLRGKPNPVLEEDLETIGEEKVSRPMIFLQRSKEQLRRRFV